MIITNALKFVSSELMDISILNSNLFLELI